MDLFAIEQSLLLGEWLIDTPATGDAHAVINLAHILVKGDPATVLTSPATNQNWTGPSFDASFSDIFSLSLEEHDSVIHGLNSKAISELASGGEPAYHLAQNALLLRLSQLLLGQPFRFCKTVPWWLLRVTLVHQQVLDEPTAYPPDLLGAVRPLVSLVAGNPRLLACLHIETGLLQHQVAQDKNAAEAFVQAAKATGLEYELSGALGKRTKFQQTEVSQLVLLAQSRLPGPAGETESKEHAETATKDSSLPETVLLNDDTLLEKTLFNSSQSIDSSSSLLRHLDPGKQPPLHPLDQCILLGLCLNVKNTSPSHGLTTEQMAPFVDRRTRTRTVERSILQLQALHSTLHERLLYFPSLLLPSKWEMERELAQRFMTMGVTRSALEIFERLEMWEDAVKCYGRLEQNEKAIAIVRDLLEGKKSESEVVVSRGKATHTNRRGRMDVTREAKLWCLLGDLEPRRARDHYQKAWDVSKESSGRAMRSLGGFHFARGEYKDAIECLEKSVIINPLLTRSWFILGCAHMRLEEWEEAKNAFVRCVTLDEGRRRDMYLRLETPVMKQTSEAEEDSLQPNNQSPSIPFSNKMMAFRALKRGLRYTPTNWRMWSNFAVIAMDVGEFAESARALARAFELTADGQGERSAGVIDLDVLDKLISVIIQSGEEREQGEDMSAEKASLRYPNEGVGLSVHVEKLFIGSILPRVVVAPSTLLAWKGKWEDALKASVDAYRCTSAATLDKNETDLEKWKKAVKEVQDVISTFQSFGPKTEEDGKASWKNQARSIVRTFTARSRENFEGEEPEWTWLTEIVSALSRDG
ncbi:hypothetical protein DL96DRAFT_1594210 [Flagelloscypha sp. PMI_526]|nr:hypothetical protein DL96DRAFT_1594210 [Flagelloscypha sp. PMI_526]